MSYILDALKKSEQERGHGSAPNVQTLHSSGLSYHSRKSQLWPYFLLAAVLINLGALLYFIMTGSEAGPPAQMLAADQHDETTGTGTAAQPNFPGATAAGATEPVRDESVFYKPVSLPVARQKTTPVATVQAEPEVAVSHYPASTVLEMDELPFEVLQNIPAMEFSAHVYSSNPLQRSLVINGRFMEEGDHLASDLYLSEITADGAIFDFQGQRFHQRIVSSWN